MIFQSISPARTLFFAGDLLKFRLSGINPSLKGRAVVRTNLGRGSLRRAELIAKTISDRTPPGADWRDIDMLACGAGEFELTLPLPEVGVFEAKCCFIPDDGSAVLWPQGDNFHIKVTSSANSAGNGIYCAFVRQFGSTLNMETSPQIPDFSSYDDRGFVIVPPSGTFRRLIAQLDHIFDELGCRILQLLPVHPVPMSYGRMGRYGSPFAATDYFAVDPALADFDTSATPMEQFEELIDAVHSRRGRIFMDIPVNHTGWASKLQCEHPDYFVRNEKKDFESPGAWGIVWADLCRLDYSKRKVHELMAKVFLFWCRHGIDGFRCDAGYMVPSEAWSYIVSRVRSEYPDTVFLLEGLGGPLPVQEKLLSQSDLDWGYSELFQNYTRDEIEHYYPYMNEAGNRFGTLANFAETHDNLRLASRGKRFAELRFLVTALLSQHGAFGFANGAEYYATEKIDVHGCGALNYGNPDNMNTLIGKLNSLLGSHPAFSVGVDVKLIQRDGGNVIAALRSGENIPELLVLINLECNSSSRVHFVQQPYNRGRDLLTEREIQFGTVNGSQYCDLAPGEALCIAFDDFIIPGHNNRKMPAQIRRQRASAMAQKTALKLYGLQRAAEADGELMLADPERFISKISGISPAPLTVWHYPEDCRREVMIPPGDALLIESDCGFTADICEEGKTLFHVTGLTGSDGLHELAMIPLPQNDGEISKRVTLKITAFTAGGIKKEEAVLLLLPRGEKRKIRLSGKWDDAAERYVFGSNCYGGYSLFSAAWGKINSKYDAILAANISREYPVDRHVMFNSMRAWLVIDDYSLELTHHTLTEYTAHPGNRALWRFSLPDGRGSRTQLTIEFAMAENCDAVQFRFTREEDDGANPAPGKLIIRPDVEDRINHTVTRACDGAEHQFPAGITNHPDGFDFHPYDRKLSLRVSDGTFYPAPEWRYMVDLPAERYYGLQDKTDLFSPGYFSIPLAQGKSATLTAWAGTLEEPRYPEMYLPAGATVQEIASDALKRFVVKRDELHTVIAGYPWFLDWGRDTLIALRGLLKLPQFHEQAAQILLRFAAFEQNGTIPNMICGNNDSNRDTSDAPLYLIIAVRDYVETTGRYDFLEKQCSSRTLKEVLNSIVSHYRSGTPNGIIADPESGLIFSPSHFSWMDTNYPAGTPREGYPVEIQALWYASLKFLGFDSEAEKVSNSIEKLFFSDGKISDCLHCLRGTPASAATADDHIRCNMLTTLTLGAVKDNTIRHNILRAAAKLLVPGAIRTLADRKVDYPLPVEHNGRLLNDPYHPYRSHYRGAEDTERKVAYHNGTAWCWPFPSYCEALYLTGGEAVRDRALSLLLSCADRFENGVIGEMPEVMDGDAPHRSGGCPAQAWSVSEFYRVLDILTVK